MANTATLSSEFQLSIPKAVCEAQQWCRGQEFAFIPKGKGILLLPVPRAEEMRGLARGAKPDAYRERLDRL